MNGSIAGLIAALAIAGLLFLILRAVVSWHWRVGAIDRLMAAERERLLTKRRPSFLRLAVDNTVQPSDY
jgi:hypothetical protein